jgi:hypothetical protein
MPRAFRTHTRGALPRPDGQGRRITRRRDGRKSVFQHPRTRTQASNPTMLKPPPRVLAPATGQHPHSQRTGSRCLEQADTPRTGGHTGTDHKPVGGRGGNSDRFISYPLRQTRRRRGRSRLAGCGGCLRWRDSSQYGGDKLRHVAGIGPISRDSTLPCTVLARRGVAGVYVGIPVDAG